MDKQIKERGIIFNGEMVRAILSGNKTQTRRIIKIQPPDRWGGTSSVVALAGHCPFGKVGDRLWVRETWSSDFANYYPNDDVWYAADDNRRLDIEEVNGVRGIYSPESDVHVPFRWRPSIHMPRWASRITLEITDIRVERLNDMSEKDAASEGVGSATWFAAKGVPEDKWTSLGEFGAQKPSHINCFASLWESIYGKDSWQSNPWVWVISFSKVEAA